MNLTMRFSNAMMVGIAILILGVILLAIRTYLDALDKIIAEKSFVHNHCIYTGCPLPPQPYWETILMFTYIGIILCCIGVIVLSIACAKQKMNVRK
ncbi:MAG: hypothetical protein KGH95_08515 [Thaumarchaeota archaeon]|nr:hypothetical protein [Nitrososphaerota archaeon]